MKTTHYHADRWSKMVRLFLPVVIALLFFIFTYSFFPFQEKIQYDTDEGLNLMRSMLVVQGYPLYTEVSSDQPPLFTHLLAVVFRLVGFKVNPGRVLVLLFSTLILWSGAQILQLTWGKLPALVFPFLIFTAPRYLELSVSVMIGLPAIALAVLALLFLILWQRDRRRYWLALSGFALALSMLTKLFTGFLAPLFLVGLTAAEWSRQKKAGLTWTIFRPALLWSLCFAGLGLLLGWIWVGPQHISDLIAPHLLAAGSELDLHEHEFALNAGLKPALPLLFMGSLGALLAILRRRWLALYLAAWAALAYIFLNFYWLVFYHHQLLITIPAAILAAAALGDGLAWLASLRRPSHLLHYRTVLAMASLAGFFVLTLQAYPVLNKELRNRPRFSNFSLKATAGKLQVLAAMNDFAGETNWIFTDMPLYAFRVQRPVPPVLATFSRKRLATGSLPEQDILVALLEYRPEQVLMARFVIPCLEAYLQEEYTLVLKREDFRLFIRNDLAPAKEDESLIR